jgi:hypothetical protein
VAFIITSPQQILYAPPLSPIRATSPTCPILLALITRIIFGEAYKKSLLFYLVPLRPKLLSQHPTREHFQPIFLPQCERSTSHPYKTTGKIKFLYILIFTFLEGGQKHLERFEIWCCRMMEIKWTDRVRNEEVLHIDKEDRIILQTIKTRRLTGFVTTCVETALSNTLLKER